MARAVRRRGPGARCLQRGAWDSSGPPRSGLARRADLAACQNLSQRPRPRANSSPGPGLATHEIDTGARAMAKGSGRAGCVVAAALAASSWQQQLGSAGWARAAAVAAASRGGRTNGAAWVALLMATAKFAAAYDGSLHWNPAADTSSCLAVWNQPIAFCRLATLPEMIGTAQVWGLDVPKPGPGLRRLLLLRTFGRRHVRGRARTRPGMLDRPLDAGTLRPRV